MARFRSEVIVVFVILILNIFAMELGIELQNMNQNSTHKNKHDHEDITHNVEHEATLSTFFESWTPYTNTDFMEDLVEETAYADMVPLNVESLKELQRKNRNAAHKKRHDHEDTPYNLDDVATFSTFSTLYTNTDLVEATAYADMVPLTEESLKELQHQNNNATHRNKHDHEDTPHNVGHMASRFQARYMEIRADPGPTGCPPEYHNVGSECFYFSDKRKDWSTARVKCEAKGATLAKVNNLQNLKDYVNKHYIYTIFWLGGHMPANEDHFVWLSGETIEGDIPWSANNPSGNHQMCLSIGYHEAYDDDWCCRPRHYICSVNKSD